MESRRSAKRQCTSRLSEIRRDLDELFSSSSEGSDGDLLVNEDQNLSDEGLVLFDTYLELDHEEGMEVDHEGGTEVNEAEQAVGIEQEKEDNHQDARTIMTKLFGILGVDSSKLNHLCKKNGFQEGSIDTVKKNRHYYKAKQLVMTVVDRMCDYLCPGNADFKDCLQPSEPVTIGLNKLHENMQMLILKGDRTTRIMIMSLLANSYTQKQCNTILEHGAEAFPIENVQQHGRIGKDRFASSRKIFPLLAAGKGIPRYNYTYRVDATKISHSMEYLQSALNLKPGITRDVSIAGHKFLNMPVYERGGQNLKKMFRTYKEVFAEDTVKLIGRDLFCDVAKLLTKRGEAKAGLSTYYINFRYRSQIFNKMLNRLMKNEYEEPAREEIKAKLKQIAKEWTEIGEYLQWEYGNKHITNISTDKCHCTFFALGGPVREGYDAMVCSRCSRCFNFFTVQLEKVLSLAKKHSNGSSSLSDSSSQSSDDDYNPIGVKEWNSMFAACGTMQKTLLQYMAHGVRAKVQFAAIKETKEKMKVDPNTILIVIDHKQKILPLKYREGQAEYFGKKGMSLLGAMIVRWVETEDCKGYEYRFSDYVFKGYAGQDNTQVAAAIEVIVNQVHKTYPYVKQIVLQSDNATCFASQELIPFIYHLNRELEEKTGPLICKWLFTEAQTGRGRLDTHFSYINVKLKSYVEDDNNCVCEEQIYAGLIYDEGIAGSTATLLDGTNIPKGGCLSKKFKSTKIGSRATHEIQWSLTDAAAAAKIIESSNVTEAERVTHQKLMQYDRVALQIVVVAESTSTKAPLYKKESDPSSTADMSATSPERSGKASAFDTALNQIEIPDIAQATPSPRRRSDAPSSLAYGWARYGGNSKDNSFSKECIETLVGLYALGKDKKKKVSAERAHQVVIDTVLVGLWDEMLYCSVAKIKAFFSLSEGKMKKAIAEQQVEEGDVYEIARGIIQEEREEGALSLIDEETWGQSEALVD